MERKHNESYKNYRERLKDSASNLKKYLKGKIVPGTESYGGRRKGRKMQYQTRQKSANLYRQQKAHSKKRRKIAYLSKRKNR